MISVIEGLAKFCERRDIPCVSDLIGAVRNEEADEADLAWVAPP
jgi:dihydroorotate dehydrogenase (NAD+) catalytic subunit